MGGMQDQVRCRYVSVWGEGCQINSCDIHVTFKRHSCDIQVTFIHAGI